MPLSDVKIRNLKPREKPYKIADKDALYLLVTPTGSKLWRMDYKINGKRKTLAIGPYPLIPLVEARRIRDETKSLVSKGVDPSSAKKRHSTDSSADGETFRQVADRWFHLNEVEWAGSYSIRLHNRLVADVFPDIGERPISDIAPKEILETIRKIESRGTIHTARRMYQMIGKVFRFAVAEGIIPSDPSRDIADALAPTKPVEHRNALPPDELPKLVERIWTDHGSLVSALGVLFTMHTMVRTAESRFAKWTEFEELDGDKPTWRLSPDRMKMRREHIVPLTPQVLTIIERLREINGKSEWVFKTPGRWQKPMSENAMLYFLYRLGLSGRSTVHGMRSSASTWLNENEFNRDWIEMQLAHVDGSVRGIYNSALYLRQRREMLVSWSNFLQPPVDGEFDDLL